MNEVDKIIPAVLQLCSCNQINFILSTKLYLIWLRTVLKHLDGDENFKFLRLVEEMENFQKVHRLFGPKVQFSDDPQVFESSVSDSSRQSANLENSVLELNVVRSKCKKRLPRPTQKRLKTVGFAAPNQEMWTATSKKGIKLTHVLSPDSVSKRISLIQNHSDSRKTTTDTNKFRLKVQLVKLPANDLCLKKLLGKFADLDVTNNESSDLISEEIDGCHSNENILLLMSDSSDSGNFELEHSPSCFLRDNGLNLDLRSNSPSVTIDPMWSSSPLYRNADSVGPSFSSTPKHSAYFHGIYSPMLSGFDAQPDLFTCSERKILKKIEKLSPENRTRSVIPELESITPVQTTSLQLLSNAISPWLTPSLSPDVADSIFWEMTRKYNANSTWPFSL